MPAELLPKEAIASVAAQVNTPDMLRLLWRVKREGVIFNDSQLDSKEAKLLKEFLVLGLVDLTSEGSTVGNLDRWVSNSNGIRVLAHLTGIAGGPHFEIQARELAGWLEEQGRDRWWNVDGDPLLTGRLNFPCSALKLANELKKIARPLLVMARKNDSAAQGQEIGKSMLDALAERLPESSHFIGGGEIPTGSGDRFLCLCWKGSPYDWMLEEDSETSLEMQRIERGSSTDEAHLMSQE